MCNKSHLKETPNRQTPQVDELSNRPVNQSTMQQILKPLFDLRPDNVEERWTRSRLKMLQNKSSLGDIIGLRRSQWFLQCFGFLFVCLFCLVFAFSSGQTTG